MTLSCLSRLHLLAQLHGLKLLPCELWEKLTNLGKSRPGSILSLADDRNWTQLHWPEKQIGGFEDLVRLRNLKGTGWAGVQSPWIKERHQGIPS